MNLQVCRLSIAAAFFLATANGCTSFRSTIANRLSNDTIRPQCETRTTRGVPVKLKVPTHVDVRIVETYFMGPGPSVRTQAPAKLTGADDIKIPVDYSVNSDHTVTLTPKTDQATPNPAEFDIEIEAAVESSPTVMHRPGSHQGFRILNVETEPIYTDKVFTVDFPRPIAGTLSLTTGGDAKSEGITFDESQYFNSIRGSYKEETLQTINEILSPSTASGTSTSSGNTVVTLDKTDHYTELKRVVAFERFDISECGWEQRMQAFVDLHITHCNPPCTGCGEPVCQNGDVYAPISKASMLESPILDSPVTYATPIID